jgi:predicted transcriptional regulator
MTTQTTFAPGFGPFCVPVIKPPRRQKASIGKIRRCLEQCGPTSLAEIAGQTGLSRNYVIDVLRDLREAGQIKHKVRGKYQWVTT